MHKFLVVLVCSQLGQAAMAKANKVLLHEQTTIVNVRLNPHTVVCSALDYGQLTIYIPQLANLTLLNHRHEGASAPSAGSSVCWRGKLPKDILPPGAPETENIPIRVTVSRITEFDEQTGACVSGIGEEIFLKVRGVPFYHSRIVGLGQRHPEDCAASTRRKS